MRFPFAAPSLLALISVLPGALAGEDRACPPGIPVPLSMTDPSDARAELSGVVLLGRQLVTISNEGLDEDKREHKVQVFEGDPAQGYRHSHDELLLDPPGSCEEADFEALARDGDTLFAIASHSLDRSKQRPDSSYEKNRRRLTRDGIKFCEARDALLKFHLSGGEEVETLQQTSLREIIDRHPVLEPFKELPNKENGIDIEGLAAKDGMLYVGFRGPVLRQNFVPILRIPQDLEQDSLEDSEILYVDLGGRGVRDIAPGPNGKGFVILAGPNGDERQSFAIYFWDGKDQVGGKDHAASKPDLRCDLGPFGDSKPEGLAFLDTTGEGQRFLLVYDGKAPLKAELRTVK